MKRFLALALVAILTAPAALAAPRAPEAYPETVGALAPAWVDEWATLAEGHEEAAWYEEAQSYLSKAEEAAQAGRVRVAMFHLETFTELTLAGRLLDEARRHASVGEQKSVILARTNAWLDESHTGWTKYRETLHELDGELHSLRAIEQAVYSADVALTSYLLTNDHEHYAREFAKHQQLDRNYVLALVRASHTPLLSFSFAHDLLKAAMQEEGLPPRVVDEAWANLTAEALAPFPGSRVPPHLENLEKLARPAKENGEALLAMAIVLAEQRTSRAQSMSTIFGDGKSRGLDVVNDASKGMRKTLNNTTLQKPQAHGLRGVFTSDAIDRALFTQEFVERGEADIGTVLVAWSALEHSGYVISALSVVSPVKPVEDTVKTPAPGLLGVLALVGVAALALRARRHQP